MLTQGNLIGKSCCIANQQYAVYNLSAHSMVMQQLGMPMKIIRNVLRNPPAAISTALEVFTCSTKLFFTHGNRNHVSAIVVFPADRYAQGLDGK